MARVNWTKHWPNKSWQATGKRLDALKKAYEKKAQGLIKAHIAKLRANKKNGIGSKRDQADIKSYSYNLLPVTGEDGTFFSVTTIVPGATDVPVDGPGTGGSLISPTPPPHP
jgi:hypothetical protein